VTEPNIGAFGVPAQAVMDRCSRNSYYRAAVETPELLQAIGLRAEALRIRAELPRIPAVPLPTTAGADLAEWLELVAHTGELERARAAKDGALEHLVAKQDALIGSQAANAERALARLNQEMAGVMDVAQSVVARLGGCTNAAQIVASGDPNVLAAYGDLRRLRLEEYDAIRTAESWIRGDDHRQMNYRSNWLLDDDLACDFTASNMDELFAQWRDRKPEFAIISASDQPQADPRPWPADPTEQLVWFVTAGARVWVPTWAQLGELGRQRMTERAHPSGATSRRPNQRQQRPNPTPTNRTSVLLNKEIKV
jgi:hypothetical protein